MRNSLKNNKNYPLNNDLQTSINVLKKQVNKLKIEIENSELKFKEYCVQLKNRIHLATAQRVKEIYALNHYFINFINHYENGCMQRHSEMGIIKQETEDLIIKSNSFLFSHCESLDRWPVYKKKIFTLNENILGIKSEIKELKLLIKQRSIDNCLLKFKANSVAITRECLGCLELEVNVILKEFYFSNYNLNEHY